jgi:hypothetical protein
MELVEARKLLDRMLVVVHAQVDQDVGQRRIAALSLHDQDRCRLLAPAVAARRLGRGEGREQPVGQQRVRRSLEGLGEGVHRLARDENVSLRRIALSGAVPRPVEAAGASRCGGCAGRVDDAELALVPTLVLREQPLHDLARAQALPQESQSIRPVTRVRVRLCRDRPHLRHGPRDDRADGEELRLDGDAPLPGLEVAGGDGERRDEGLSHR